MPRESRERIEEFFASNQMRTVWPQRSPGGIFAPGFVRGKVFWAAGKDWESQIEAVFDTTICYAASQPYICIYDTDLSRARNDLWPDLIQWLRGEIARRKKSLTERIKNLPSMLRMRPNASLRIWTFDDFRGKARYTTIQSVLMRSLLFHLRKFGYETRYTVLRDGCYYPPYYRIFQMAEFEPDLIFLCNQGPAYEMALGADLSRSLNIPKVVWFADDPVYAEHLLLRHKVSPDETYLVADYEWGDPLVENGSSPPLFMPGAATRTHRAQKTILAPMRGGLRGAGARSTRLFRIADACLERILPAGDS
jgi:hypothetical protein